MGRDFRFFRREGDNFIFSYVVFPYFYDWTLSVCNEVGIMRFGDLGFLVKEILWSAEYRFESLEFVDFCTRFWRLEFGDWRVVQCAARLLTSLFRWVFQKYKRFEGCGDFECVPFQCVVLHVGLFA